MEDNMRDISETTILEESFISGKKKFEEETKVYIAEESLIPEHLQKVTNIEQAINIARGIFEEENIHIAGNRIYIRFPKLEITNSKGEKHTIYNIIVKLTIYFREEGYVRIGFDGTRTSLTVDEVKIGYRHSHLESNKFGQFTPFCLGSSNFAIVLSNVSTNSTATNWIQLFMSIENYLIWESLEGGPHIRIERIGNSNSITVSPTEIEKDTDRIISSIPMDCIDFDTISLIEGEVITDFINSNANIRRLRTVMEYTERDISEAQEKITELGKKIIWRDGFIPFEIVRKESNVKDDSVPTVEPMLREIYIEYIKKELDKFRKNYKHEQYKKTKPRSYYTIGKTKADNLREAPGANKLSS